MQWPYLPVLLGPHAPPFMVRRADCLRPSSKKPHTHEGRRGPCRGPGVAGIRVSRNMSGMSLLLLFLPRLMSCRPSKGGVLGVWVVKRQARAAPQPARWASDGGEGDRERVTRPHRRAGGISKNWSLLWHGHPSCSCYPLSSLPACPQRCV